MKQQENQPVDDFVNALRTKAQECEFLELTESLIKDRIFCGINSSKLQERLLREPDLTLDRAILLCKADEDARKQTTEIQKHTGTAEGNVDAIKTNYKSRKQFTKPEGGFPVIAETTRNHTFSKEISKVILAAMVLAPNFYHKNCLRVISAMRGNPP